MPEPARGRPDSQRKASPAVLPLRAAGELTEFARACRAAARAVSLYPAGHPAIETTLTRLGALSATLTATGSYSVQALADRLLVDGAGLPAPDPTVSELGTLLHRHLIGRLTINQGATAESWRALLLLLARSADDVRADGGMAHLWSTAGGPSLEIEEIDYAEVLREKQGLAQTIEEILAAAVAGPLHIDDRLSVLIAAIVSDPAKSEMLMRELERVAGVRGPDGIAAVFVALLRGVVEHTTRSHPSDLAELLRNLGEAAARMPPSAMAALLDRRRSPDAVVGGTNVVTAMVDHMSERAVIGFVTASVVAERGATERLAHAFTALVPEIDRRRQLL